MEEMNKEKTQKSTENYMSDSTYSAKSLQDRHMSANVRRERSLERDQLKGLAEGERAWDRMRRVRLNTRILFIEHASTYYISNF